MSTPASVTSSAPSAPAVESGVNAPPGGLPLSNEQKQQDPERKDKENVEQNAPQGPNVLDLVFLVDSTSSMGTYIQ